MTQTIKIRLLDDAEARAVLALPEFNTLKPAKCEDCGQSNFFSRKVFNITGVKKDQHADDGIQSIITSHIRKNYGITYVFFKTPNRKFYADTACCPKCQSTKIIFDIELTDDFLQKAAKFTGKPIEELRQLFAAERERLEKS